MKRIIAVGSRVRFVIRDYYLLSKSGYLEFFSEVVNGKERTLLGSEFEIVKVEKNKWGVKIYECKNEFYTYETFTDADLVLIEEEPDCPFAKNDNVRFSREINNKNSDFLRNIYSFDYNYIIAEIINKYYVLLKKQDGGIILYPISWKDLQLSNSKSHSVWH